MKNVIFFAFISICTISCAQSKSEILKYDDGRNFILKLQRAELNKDLELLKTIFTDDAIILFPDSPPFVSKDAILELYQFLWNRKSIISVEYIINSVKNYGKGRTLIGNYIFEENGNKIDTIPFQVEVENIKNQQLISSIIYGNVCLDEIKMKLTDPSGDFKVGYSNFFYDAKFNSNNRKISFEIWYPTKDDSGKTKTYQGLNVTNASSQFLGWPLFQASFFSTIQTNSFKNADAIKNQNFPILIYNHGYGGFSSVYQTVFEELASHGYVVVSIGHENESALLIVNEDSILKNSPENEFYTKRASELNGAEINNLQSVILNSDNSEKVNEAYVELVKLSPLHKESTELWASDTKQVIYKLNELNEKNEIFKGSFDLNVIGVFGHSVGGATAGELAYNCEAIKAGINLDGFQFGNLINNQIEIPFMFVSSNQQDSRYLRIVPFRQNAKAEFHHAVIKGLRHENFSDLSLTVYKNQRAINIQRKLILDFFNKYLKGENIDLTELENNFEEISFK